MTTTETYAASVFNVVDLLYSHTTYSIHMVPVLSAMVVFSSGNPFTAPSVNATSGEVIPTSLLNNWNTYHAATWGTTYDDYILFSSYGMY